MDAQKSEKSIYTEWVKCPYCHEVIKAPNQPDMTFLCPNCCKELITYDKKKEIEQLKEEKKEQTDTIIMVRTYRTYYHNCNYILYKNTRSQESRSTAK